MSDYSFPASDKTVRGRKDYYCDGCGQLIPKGHPHNYHTGKWDGEIFTLRHHTVCIEIERALNNHRGTYWEEWWPMREWDVDDWIEAARLHPENLDKCPAWLAIKDDVAAEAERIARTCLEPATND